MDRCILGTIAVKDFPFTARMAQLYGAKVAVGVDARDGFVAISGWKELSRERGVDFCRRLPGNAGVRRSSTPTFPGTAPSRAPIWISTGSW